MFDANTIKLDFPIFRTNPGLVYLDSAASAQKLQMVIDAERRFYEESYANVHRGIYSLSMKATDLYEEAREKVRKFINAKSTKEIIFVRGATEGINLVASSLARQLVSGDVILISEMEHHANIVPWQGLTTPSNVSLAQTGTGHPSSNHPFPTAVGLPSLGRRRALEGGDGVTLRWIPVTESGELDLSNIDELLKGVKLVAVTQMSNVLGTVNDVKYLARKAHAIGAKILVDAAQSVPHMPVDVQDLDCDFLVFSGHKMCGPMGIGVLYGRQEILEQMEPYQRGGDMILEVTKENATWNELPYKFEAGTPNAAGAVGLGAAIDYLASLGMENVWGHERELREYGLGVLGKVEGVTMLGAPSSPARPSSPRQARGRLGRGGDHPRRDPSSNHLFPTAVGLPSLGRRRALGGGDDFGRAAIFAFTIDGVHPHDIGSILDEQNIAIRAGHHCAQPLHKRFGLVATARASCYLYNNKEDIDALVRGIIKIKEMFN